MCLCSQPSLTERTVDDHRQLPARYGAVGSALRGRLAAVLLHHAGGHDLARDRRHTQVKVQVAKVIPERIFGEWSMLHDPARSWIWTHEEVAGGAAEHSTPEKVIDFFMKVRASLQI